MDSKHVLELIEVGFEIVGVAALIIGSANALFQYVLAFSFKDVRARMTAYRELRKGVGRAIMIGLEFLIAADIIRSVALEPTLPNIAVLGLIVIVRTILSWSLEVEISGEWPWRRREHAAKSGNAEDASDL